MTAEETPKPGPADAEVPEDVADGEAFEQRASQSSRLLASVLQSLEDDRLL